MKSGGIKIQLLKSSKLNCICLCWLVCLSSEDGPASDHQTGAHSDQVEDRLFAGTPGEDREAAESRVR